MVEHQIELEDTRPIRRPQYRVPFALRGEMKAQVENMLAKGVIRESSSPWSAPTILVPKKSADGKPKYRFCVDFRALNVVTKFDPYPYRYLNSQPLPSSARNTLPFLVVIVAFVRSILKKRIKKKRASLSRSVTMNFIGCLSACQIAPRISRG